jgi:sec-independent protein translocase protein TatA
MLGLRAPELLVILVVCVLLFGSKKIPELGDSLGKGIRAFKKATEQGFADDDSTPAKVQGQLHASSTAAPASVATEKPSVTATPAA